MDLGCVMTDFAAVNRLHATRRPFRQSLGQIMRSRSNSDVRIPRMIERAKAHRWSGADFERLRLEIQGFTVWSAREAWHEAWVKDEAKIKEWANR